MDLPNTGIKPGSPALQADSLPTELTGKPQEVLQGYRNKKQNSPKDESAYHQTRKKNAESHSPTYLAHIVAMLTWNCAYKFMLNLTKAKGSGLLVLVLPVSGATLVQSLAGP